MEDPLPEILVQERLYEPIKQLLSDIENIYARTGNQIYPLTFLGLLYMIASWCYFYATKAPEVDAGTIVIREWITIFVPAIPLYLFFNLILPMVFRYKRNKEVNEKLDTFNKSYESLAIRLEWNQWYQYYSDVMKNNTNRRQRILLAKASQNLKLLLKMNIVARQKYCHENGIEFQMPNVYQWDEGQDGFDISCWKFEICCKYLSLRNG